MGGPEKDDYSLSECDISIWRLWLIGITQHAECDYNLRYLLSLTCKNNKFNHISPYLYLFVLIPLTPFQQRSIVEKTWILMTKGLGP